MILLISTSQVAMIRGMSHWYPAGLEFPVLLSQPPECWDYRYALTCLVYIPHFFFPYNFLSVLLQNFISV
jgi:hypothetical protein